MDEVLGRLCISAKDGGGPLVGGSDWYSGMSAPDEKKIVHPTGDLWGGHCYDMIQHVAPTAKRSRLIGFGNSHLDNFVFYMEDTEVEWLFFGQGGELAAVTELPKAA